MYKIQYAQQQATGIVYKRRLQLVDGNYVPDIRLGAWKPVPSHQSHPWNASPDDLELLDMMATAIYGYDQQLGACQFATSLGYADSSVASTQFTIPTNRPSNVNVNFELIPTVGASLTDVPVEFAVNPNATSVQVQDNTQASSQKDILSDLGVSGRGRQVGAFIAVAAVVCGIAYLGYKFIFKSSN